MPLEGWLSMRIKHPPSTIAVLWSFGVSASSLCFNHTLLSLTGSCVRVFLLACDRNGLTPGSTTWDTNDSRCPIVDDTLAHVML